MRKGLLVGIVVIAFGVGGVWSISAWRGATQSDLPVAAVLPPGTLYYVEARNVRGLVEGVRASGAWQDLQSSGLLDVADAADDEDAAGDSDGDAADGGGVAALAAEVADLSEKIGYSLDEAAAMKFLGAEAALAVWMNDADARHVTMVTRIDAQALAKDLLGGELDWRALQAELNARAERAELVVKTEPYLEYEVSTLTKGEATVYTTLLEDLLVISDDRAGVTTAIDLRVARGEASLDALPAFADEMTRLPGGAPLRDWINVAELKRRKPDMPGVGGEAMSIAPMIDAIAAPAVARAIELPENDLYQLSWTWSRQGDELFVDAASPRLRDVFPGDPMVYVEARRLGQLIEAWNASPIKAHLEGSWAAKKLEEALAEGQDELEEALLPFSEQDAPDLASDEFTKRFALNLGRRAATSMFGGDAALVVVRRDGQDAPAVLVAVRLGTDGRMAELFVRSAVDAYEKETVASFEHGGRTIRGASQAGAPGPVAYWVTAGDLLLFGTDIDTVQDALDRIDGPTAGQPSSIAAAAEGLPDDYRLLMTVSVPQYVALATSFAADDPDPDIRAMSELMGLSMPYDTVALAVYVADDLSQIEVRARAVFDDRDGKGLLKPAYDVARGAPRSLDVLPDGAILTYAARMDLAGILAGYRAKDLGELMKPVNEAIAEFEQNLEVQLDESLIPALGDEFAMTVLFEKDAAMEGAPPIPGLAFLVGIDDRAPITDLLDKLADMGRRAAEEDAAAPQIVTEMRGDTPVYTLRGSEGNPIPFTPTATYIGDFLVLALDMKAVDDMGAVGDGVRRSQSASDLHTRVRAAGLPPDGNEFYELDWDLLLDQVAVYAPQLAEAFVDDDAVPMPEFPDDGDMDEWQRRLDGYQKARGEAASGKTSDVIGAIDSLRFIDFMASVIGVRGDALVSHAVVRFKR